MIWNGHLWSFLIIVGIILPSLAFVDESLGDKDVIRKTVGQLLDYKNFPPKGILNLYL